MITVGQCMNFYNMEDSMEKLKPKLLSVMKQYNKHQFLLDLKAGIIVAIIALPLSIAFALGCGISAEKGIWASIIASILVALFGGSRVQITGPTGAFIVITQSIVAGYGTDGLMIAMILAGIMLILMGIFRLGKLVKYIPSPITIGFTAGIGVTIFTLEMKDFFGLTIDKMPTNFIGKWITYFKHIGNINWQSVLLGSICIVILVIWPKVNKTIPNSFIAIVVGTVLSLVFKMEVKTLGTMPKTLSLPVLPALDLDDIFGLAQPAFTIAILVAMQALLSAVVTDGLINSKHRANMELIAQGIANLVLGVLGCIPTTGGVARSIANAKNGGRTPIAAIVHGVMLFIFLTCMMPLIQYIPLCVLAAILIVVSINMFNFKVFFSYIKAPKSDFAVLLSSCILTFAFDLVLAIEVGMVLSCVLFMKRMSDCTNVQGWKYLSNDAFDDEESDPDNLNLKIVPKGTLVYEFSGPMFFGAADKISYITEDIKQDTKAVILRMRGVPAMDATALTTLRTLHDKLAHKNISLIFSHVLEQPLSVMNKAGFTETVPQENFCANIDFALERANQIISQTSSN